ncbi:MAG: hypothetical protein HZR80_03155 [Candidatus Heimdallarchaeota archaeon]
MLNRNKFATLLIFGLLVTSSIMKTRIASSITNYDLIDNFVSPQANTSNLEKIGHFTGGKEVVSVATNNGFAYLADQEEGLLIVDITKPESPILVNKYQAENESVYDVKVEGNIAFVAHGSVGLKILDVTDPNNIIEKSEFDNGGLVWKVFLKDNMVFVVDRTQGLEIINIDDIENPTLLGVYEGQPYDVYVDGKFAYVAAGLNKGLEVVDISKLESPKKISELSFDRDDTVGISVKGKYAFVANKEHGMKIVSISRPRNPKIIYEYYDNTSQGRTWNVFTQDSFVYLANELEGMEVLDVSDPNNPHKIGAFSSDSGVRIFNIILDNDLIFLASFDSGLEILSWKTAPPKPMVDNYIQLDSRTFNFNHSVGPFITETLVGNESIGMNLSLSLDVGLMSLIEITIDIPLKIKSGELTNLKIGISGENSSFWGKFDGSIKFFTPFGPTPTLTFSELGVPNFVDLVAFQTFIGEEIIQDAQLFPITLLEESFLNYTYAFIMTPIFNVTGSATVSAETSNANNEYEFTWTSDGEQIILPITIPEDAKETYGLQIEKFYFNIDELKIDLGKIRFDVILADLLPIYSWEINMSDFVSPLTSVNNQEPYLLYPNQPTNQTILFLDGIYPMGDFLIILSLSQDLTAWAILLILLGTLAIIVIPWILIFTNPGRKKETQQVSEEVNE